MVPDIFIVSWPQNSNSGYIDFVLLYVEVHFRPTEVDRALL